MAKALSLDLLSNSRNAVAGVKDVGAELEKVADSLDDVAKEAQTSGDKLGDGLAQGAEDARRDVDSAAGRMERSFMDLAKVSKRESKEMGDTLAKETKDGARKAESALDSLKDEGKANFAETASSFDGSMESAVGGIQGTLGGLATALGPVGAIGAGLAAAGVGIASTFAADWAEKQEEVAQNFRDLYREAAEEGRTFLSESQIQAAAYDILFGEDKAKVDRIRKDAERIGVDFDTLLLAHAGDQDALAVAIEAAGDAYKGVYDERSSQTKGYSMMEGAQKLGVQGVVDELNNLQTQHQKNSRAAQTAAAIAKEMAEKQRDAAIKTSGGFLKAGETLDGLADKIRGMPTPKRLNVPVHADTSQVPAAIRALQNRKYSFNVQANIVDRYGRRPV